MKSNVILFLSLLVLKLTHFMMNYIFSPKYCKKYVHCTAFNVNLRVKFKWNKRSALQYFYQGTH